MSTEEELPLSDSVPQVADHPPMNPRGVVYPVKAAWPTVVGAISIALGVLGIFGGLCGAGFMLIVAMFPDSFAEMGMDENMVSGNATVFTLLSAVISVGLAIALLSTGIGMCRRRYWTASAIQWWAALYLPYKLAASIIGMVMQKENMEAQLAAQNVTLPGMTLLAVAGSVVTFLVAAALPVFVLIWFRRASVKTEVESWT